ncbi:hypothetical protein JNW88_00115 [Micromonospora sp. ATA32]|nr:hypothetical protein [Micromonospora sp. ATA32]
MSANWRDQVPSWTETEQRATDEGEAQRDRVLDVLLLVTVVVLLLTGAIAVLRGDLS